MPHVVSVVSPYTTAGAVEVSHDRQTAFATINYAKRANLLPDATGKPVLDAIDKIDVPGLKVAAGGQVIEQAEGFNIGPATSVGVIAALVILLLTFGSLIAAGMPLVTAGLGLITGIALVGLATHVTDMSNVSPELALMIGLGVGIDYALFIVTRFRENFRTNGDVEESVVQAMDTSGRAILLAGTTVIIALLGMFATGVTFLYGLSIASVLAVLLVLVSSLTVLPALLSRWGEKVGRPSRRTRRRAEKGAPPRESSWRRWSLTVQSRPWPLAVASLLVMLSVPGTGPRVAARLERRRQRPVEHEHLPGLQPALAGLRRRFQRAAARRRRASRPGTRRGRPRDPQRGRPHARRRRGHPAAHLAFRQGRGDGGVSGVGSPG